MNMSIIELRFGGGVNADPFPGSKVVKRLLPIPV